MWIEMFFLVPFLNQVSIEVPSPPSRAVQSHTEPWAPQGEQGQENECGWDFGTSQGWSLPKPGSEVFKPGDTWKFWVQSANAQCGWMGL